MSTWSLTHNTQSKSPQPNILFCSVSNTNIYTVLRWDCCWSLQETNEWKWECGWRRVCQIFQQSCCWQFVCVCMCVCMCVCVCMGGGNCRNNKSDISYQKIQLDFKHSSPFNGSSGSHNFLIS